MGLTKYAVGDVIENFKGQQESVRFDIDDGGATMLVFFNSPTENEIRQFTTGNRFEIRFTVLYDIIMITAKIGNLEWMDAPYSPHLSQSLTKIELPQDGQGLALTLMLVDCSTGQIKHIRMMGLSEKFSKSLLGAVMEEKMKPFDQREYGKNLQTVYSRKSTKDIVSLSSDYCKIN